MPSIYSYLYQSNSVVSRKLFPDDIEPVFVTGDGVNNFAQYKKNGKLYSSFFNLDKVLMTYEDTQERKILFENGFAINIENSKYFISDANLIMRSTICELLNVEPLKYNSRVVGIASLKNFGLKAIAYQNKKSLEIKDKENECLLAFYKIHDCRLYNPVLPEYIQEIKVVGDVNNIVSLDENMSTYYTSAINETRVVGIDKNFTKKYSKPFNFSNEYSLTRYKFENTGIILIYHNNWKSVTYYDYTKKIVINTFNTLSQDAFFSYYIKSKMYNQLYQMSAFNGEYVESMDFQSLQQTQGFSISGYFDDKAILYNLTSEILTTDGYFIRGSNKSINNVARIEVTLNNLAILNDYYIIFYVKAFNTAGAPAPFVNINLSIPLEKIPGEGTTEDHNYDTNDLRRYFEPNLGGIISDSAKTDIDGTVYLFVKSINADVADHLQGCWWFKIDASADEFYMFDEVVNYHRISSEGQTQLTDFRNEIRSKYSSDLPNMEPHFVHNI